MLEFLDTQSPISSFQLSEEGVFHHSCFEDEKTEDQIKLPAQGNIAHKAREELGFEPTVIVMLLFENPTGMDRSL